MKTLIIAEAGVNHNGNFELAKQLVDKAVEGGADIVKFQTCKAENVISRYADKAEYQKVTTGEADSQLEMVRKLMLTYEEYGKLKDLPLEDKKCGDVFKKNVRKNFDLIIKHPAIIV